MSDLSVTPASVESLSASVDASASGIEGQLSTLRGAKQQLLGAWVGEAANAYSVAQDEWLQKVQALAGVAHAAAEAAHTAATAYREADEAVGKAWGL
ncbi:MULTISPECIES: WXG100 family type VII secretion target [unclassified Microbacterium]|uniref:WXG100 family type VII secretion target n=1 Tax=unclassified Microbacterium TaxID=2609290 RepID=UPI00214CC699|nr:MULTISPECIES: WXG100 family type VII secretion target [unclassified Microbacterium]MCR2785507.1 WXG100 family type VII secretion target [Microbacterium sp. zg.B96]MDL5350369.1 WXG100 family type VII secretion target [Microbacterium sp. zg-YB36]WIM17503.1 WXG100 family type VII secretion target [Microbacterium sp. zg-B96]